MKRRLCRSRLRISSAWDQPTATVQSLGTYQAFDQFHSATGEGEPPPLEEVLKTMRERAAKFNVEKIKPQDLAGAAGPPDEET